MAKRVQVQDLQKVALQPQARPVDTFVTPGGQPPSSNLDKISESLRGFSKGLNYALEQRDQRNRVTQTDAAEQRVAKLSYEEAQLARANGTLALNDDPYHVAAIEQFYGVKRADHRTQQILSDIESNKLNVFELGAGGIEQALAGSIEEDLGDIGDTQAAVSYTRNMKQARDRILGKTGEILRAEDKRVSSEASYENFKSVAENAIASGASPEEVFAAVREQYNPTAGLYGLNYREQDEVLFSVLENLSTQEGGNYDAVHALLMTDRGVAGVLANKDPDKAQSILDAAKKANGDLVKKNAFDARVAIGVSAQKGELNEAMAKELRLENPDMASDAEWQSWIEQSTAARERKLEKLTKATAEKNLEEVYKRNEAKVSAFLTESGAKGGYHYLTPVKYIDAKGKEKEYTVKQLQERMVEERVAASDARVRAGENPDAVFAEDAAWFSSNATVNPRWKGVLSNGFVGASPALLAGDGTPPPALSNSIDLYEKLHAANPQLLDKHITDSNGKDFYDFYRIARQNGGYAKNDAMSLAVKVTSDPTHFEVAANKANTEMIESAADDALDGAVNSASIKREVSRLAVMYMATGIGVDEAVTLASERISNTHTEINGYLVPTSDRMLPATFPSMAEYWLKKYATDHNIDGDDITLLPISSDPNHFLVINHALGRLANPGGVNRVSLQDIKLLDDERVLQVRAAAEELSREEAPKRAYDAQFRTQTTDFGDITSKEAPQMKPLQYTEKQKAEQKALHERRMRGTDY